MRRRTIVDASHVLLGFAAIWLLVEWGGADIGFGGGTAHAKREAGGTKPRRKSRGTHPIVIDVHSPQVREATAAERARYKKTAQQAGTVSASPVLEPHHGPRIPSGYNPDMALSRASAIAAHLATKGPRAYSHEELASWQLLAGIRPDGGYGGSTRGALVFYGVTNPPRPFSAPFATLPYHPPEIQP